MDQFDRVTPDSQFLDELKSIYSEDSMWTPMEMAVRVALHFHPSKDEQGFVKISRKELASRIGLSSTTELGATIGEMIKAGNLEIKKGHSRCYRPISLIEWIERSQLRINRRREVLSREG